MLISLCAIWANCWSNNRVEQVAVDVSLGHVPVCLCLHHLQGLVHAKKEVTTRMIPKPIYPFL